jgi:rod shape-determining protein MreC
MKTSRYRFVQAAVLVILIGLVIFALSGYMRPIFRTVTSPFIGAQEWLSSRYLAIYEFVTVPRDVATLSLRNQELENEVAGLQAQIIELQQQLREAQLLYALLDFARARPQSQYVAAAVIGVDPSPFLHYVIIDHGSDDGLRYGMPVVTDQGLVGRVDAVTANAARVQLITDPGSVANVVLEGLDADGQISGSVTGEIALNMVSQEVDLQPGVLVMTSGLGGSYPSDLLIGQVISIRKSSNELFQSAVVQPVVNFSTLKAVLVITNFRPVDITPLLATQIP